MDQKSTAILLATYNGERYLIEQIESLYAQTNKNWVIYVHDDGSTDGTMKILEEYEKNKNNFFILRYPSQKGASNNFFSLLKNVEAKYYFFADQDDKWLPLKIEKTMECMKKIENANHNKPILVCCDAYVADSNLRIISDSLWKQAGTHPDFLTTFNTSAASPFVTGCTMVINQEAKNAIIWKHKNKATMHDAFITLCVLKQGGIVFPLHKSYILYRQHGDNTLGAYSNKNNNLSYKIKHFKYIIKTDIALLRMLYSLDYGNFLKFLYYKHIYKKKCRAYDKRNSLN